MNMRSQVKLDPEQQKRAEERAAEKGISLAEYVRQLIADDLGDASRTRVSDVFNLVQDGPRTDIARQKHRMLGEAVARRKAGGKVSRPVRTRSS
jgi:hypothetical protein